MSSMNAVREPRTFHPIYPIVDAGYASTSSTPATRSSTPATLSSTPATLSSTTSTLSAISLTSLSMAFVISRSCAEAIRASSCVSLSSLFSASSISLFPISFLINFFRYFSGNGSINGNLFVTARTYSFDLV
jgi:hypothetical protein